jgi:hypothetical protein
MQFNRDPVDNPESGAQPHSRIIRRGARVRHKIHALDTIEFQCNLLNAARSQQSLQVKT